MADLITDLVSDLTAKLETISAIEKRIIYMYDGDDLLTSSEKVGLPSIGIVYNNMTGKIGERKQGPQGLLASVTMDIYILGGQQCVEKISEATGIKITTTGFLEQIRRAIQQTLPQPASGNAERRAQTRTWSFVLEQPVFFDDQSISYVQRWQCDVGLT